jgi:hypothetical protein
MPQTYTTPLNIGFSRAPRTGDRINVWGAKVNECAARLDAMDLPPEAVEVLKELFEEIGQLTRDGWATK